MHRLVLLAFVTLVYPGAALVIAKDVGTLKATAGITDKVLIIRNNTGGSLTACNIYVNSRFELRGVDIPVSGREFRWPAFMTRNDVRFDPALDEAKRVHILCREGDVALSE
ncbi:hypothetical protein PQJ75_03245 [Rhodoplanes sp. TEM]|uniref:Uncharacterized protein n=1 Tax=Rhodoplanes tepidamans TaxID=200616 RepID=A0ABT5JHC1_RHOTP|nr:MULTISPECIES: hypothetical protein [Rhodoplanes]MDC7789118.1 hypothetical protein [Rhodoplanes tepidamans]MDC7982735.1 hypothetical protein [Rhodoplanes sp. TEM]MDQ0357436.1 hypothetical protein [Rhodoplanes tepidamans]